MIATIVILMIYLAIQSFVMSYFSEINQSKKFKEVTYLHFKKEPTSEVFLELINSCIRESVENYNCKNGYVTCYFIVTDGDLSQASLPKFFPIEYKGKLYYVDANLFNPYLSNALIIFNCKKESVLVINY